MKELFGKLVLTDLEERVTPDHTALIVVDMQNDFCTEGGMIHRLGSDLGSVRGIVPRLQRLLHVAREAGVLIIYIKNRSHPDGRYSAPADLARRLLTYAPIDDPLITKEGSWGEEIIEELRPQQEDVIIYKHRPDAFERTQLGLVLRSNGIKSVVVTGTATFACVESSARRAMMEDFYVTVIEDCSAATDPALHQASLHAMKAFFGDTCVCPAERLISAWQQYCVTSIAAVETF